MTDTTTLTLSEFLKERWREEEQAWNQPGPLAPLRPFQLEVLMSKRAIVDQVAGYCWERGHSSDGTEWHPCGHCDRIGCRTLRLLAAPYRKHPDYREEWA